MRELGSPMEDAQIESPSQDHGDRFGPDERIRGRGYEIAHRPVRGEAVWLHLRSGKLFRHSQVLKRERLE